jgi:hypothetical protein
MDTSFVERPSMKYGSIICLATLLAAGARPALAVPPIQVGNAQVTRPSDLPAHTYVIQGKPSDVVQNHEAILALARQLETTLKADIESLGTRDKATLTRMYSSLMAIAMVKRDHAAARRYLELVRELQDNPAVKLLTGLITIPYMQAMEEPGTDFRATFRTLLSKRLAGLPFEEVRATLGAMKNSQASASKAQLIGSIVAGVDPAVKDGQISQQIAEALVGAAMNLEVILHLKEDVVACIENFFNANKAPQTTATAAGTTMQSAVGTLGRSQEKFAGYLDQAPPGHTPRVFALQTHDGYFAGDRIAISADGKELYYTEVTSTWSDYNIRYYKYFDGKWNGPVDLFTGFLGPALSVDDKTMFFEKYNDDRTGWHSKRTDTGWSTPTLCTEAPDPKDKHYLQDTASGRIYASSQGAPNGIGQRDISTYVKTDATRAYQSLGRPLNSPGNEGDFYVARDEAFIVFGSPHRGGFGGGDLFISFRESDGSWSDPKNLGATVNTPGFEFGPYVTDDKRYLFYSSSSDFSRVDIYWIRFDSLLETLRAGRARQL